MASVPAEAQGPSDAELIDAVRKGTVSAYGDLYERHVAAAYNLARQLSRSLAQADDLVSEAFAKVLETLKAGRGPDSAFRPYLLTALRHTAYDKTRRDKKVELSEDVSTVSGVSAEAVSVPFVDPAVAGLERSLAARAFARLPERWQAVLWHTEIEGQSPAEAAPLLGLTPNGVSSLSYRAREGLKQAYLQVYLGDPTEQRCRATVDRLGAWTRGGLAKREKAQVGVHLDKCARCRALAAELADVNSGLRVFIAPLVLGSGTVGYLATASAVAAKAAIAGGVVAVSAGAAAAGSAGGGAAASGAGAFGTDKYFGVAAGAAGLAVAVALALTVGGQQIPQAESPAIPPANSPALPVPGTTASVLRIREAPTTSAPIRGRYPLGTVVTVECQTTGTEVDGNNLWNRTDRGFIADRYITRTGTPPQCLLGTTASVLRIREAPTTSAPIHGRYPQGTIVTIECQTTGTEVDGNNLWNRTDRGFVSDRYVNRSVTPSPC